MHPTTKFIAAATLALLGGLLAMPAFAAPGRGGTVAMSRNTAAIRSEQATRMRLIERPASTTATGDKPKDLRANAFRTYPPSCLSDPLPENVTGPHWSRSVDLYEVDGNGNNSYETVTITLWRVACSSGGAFFNSATLMRIDRQSDYEGDDQVYPLFPDVRVAQNNEFNDIGFDDYPLLRDRVRVATEPNTVISQVLPDAPVISSATYVLGNYPYQNSGYFDFNLPFTIRFDNLYVDDNGQPLGQFFINVPGYAPTPPTYPDAYAPLPINGYLSSNWYDPNHGGEGVITQVAEYPPTADGIVYREMVFDWFTFDDNGNPFWISGNATVDSADPTRLTVPAVYSTDGGFAGNFGSSATQVPWGTVTFEFADCNHLTFSFNSSGSQPAGVPTGSGTLDLIRLVNVNGLTCE